MILWTRKKMVNELRKLRDGHYGRKYSCKEIAAGIGIVHPITVQDWLGAQHPREGGTRRHKFLPSLANAERIRTFLIRLKLHPELPDQSGDPELDAATLGEDALAYDDDTK